MLFSALFVREAISLGREQKGGGIDAKRWETIPTSQPTFVIPPME